MQQTTFDVQNSTDMEMYIVHEPECFEFILQPNEEVTIEIDSCKNSICIKTFIDNGRVMIALLGEKSLYSVYYKGKNVFEEYLD